MRDFPYFPSTTHITAHKARNESHPPGFAPLLLFKCFFASRKFLDFYGKTVLIT